MRNLESLHHASAAKQGRIGVASRFLHLRRIRSIRRMGLGIAALASTCALIFACGTDAVGIDACRQIETARCLQAPNCGIDLSTPVHRDAPKTDIDACIRFYHEQCLHGLASGKEPGQVQVTACIDVITNGSCEVVKQPETDPACAWLIPPITTTTDAGTDTSTDAAVDETSVDAGYQCPAGCTDLGTAVPLCQGIHECACPAALTSSSAVCQLAGANSDETIAYCCQ